MIRFLGVQTEFDKAMSELDLVAERRGQWKGLDTCLNLLNTYEKRTILKSDLYKNIMEMRPH